MFNSSSKSSNGPLEFNSSVRIQSKAAEKSEKTNILKTEQSSLMLSICRALLMSKCRQNKQVVKRHFFRAQLYWTIELYE